MPWPIMICDEDQGIIDANQGLEELFQRKLPDIIGHNTDEFFLATEEKLKLSPFADVHRLQLPNKESLLVAQYQTPIVIAPGRTILLYVVIDMSLALDMQQEQMRSAELVGIFQTIATVNHELNNPLFGLMATLQLLTEEMKDADPAIVRKLARMTECSERIKQIS
ncbi:MAG: histidine kinase dimerization/phospho-acceptor domain-containing protein, partial [bacterium]